MIRQRDDGTIVFADENGVEQLPSAEVEYSLVVEGQKKKDLAAAKAIEAKKAQQQAVIAAARQKSQAAAAAQAEHGKFRGWLQKVRQDTHRIAVENAALESLLKLPSGFDQTAKVENKNPTVSQNLSGFAMEGTAFLKGADADFGQKVIQPARYRQEIYPGEDFGYNNLNLTDAMVQGKRPPKRVIVKTPAQAKAQAQQAQRAKSGKR